MTLLPIMNDQDIPVFNDITQVHNTLHDRGCRRCDLGFQANINGCCVSRGTFDTRKMIIGEAPGKEEDARGAPFTGPAGKLMDQIWYSAGMNSSDWYISNVIHCRPVAQKGSGKENLTPKTDQIDKCKVYIENEIKLLKPELIVTLGAIATSTILGIKGMKMGDYRGKLVKAKIAGHSVLVFPMLHPAALLHAKGNKDLYTTYRLQMWEDAQMLKQKVTEMGI